MTEQTSDVLPDEDLIARVVEGDKTAFATLYDRYSPVIYAMALRLLGHQTDAEEALQDIFIHLWDKAALFDAARGAFRPWFITLARNYLRDTLRRTSRDAVLITADELDQFIAQRPGIEDELWDRERRASLLVALQQIPREQRRVILLSYFSGFSHTEIAAYLELPPGTVKKRIRLGMQKLRHLLNGHELSNQPIVPEEKRDAR